MLRLKENVDYQIKFNYIIIYFLNKNEIYNCIYYYNNYLIFVMYKFNSPNVLTIMKIMKIRKLNYMKN